MSHCWGVESPALVVSALGVLIRSSCCCSASIRDQRDIPSVNMRCQQEVSNSDNHLGFLNWSKELALRRVAVGRLNRFRFRVIIFSDSALKGGRPLRPEKTRARTTTR